MMVDENIKTMYGQVIEYLTSKQNYYSDSNSPDGEFGDYRDGEDFDLTSVIDVIQRQIQSRPNMGEAATIKCYRDLKASGAEYDIRLMARSDYWSDASKEESDNIDKWTFNKKNAALRMMGRDMGQ